MKLRAGDIVINPSMPQWGPGEIITVDDGKALVRFRHNVIRKMAVSFLALADTGECPEPVRKKDSRPASAPPASSPETSGLIAQAMSMMQGSEASSAPSADPALDSAERAADFAADVKKKEREDRKRRQDAAILRFWRDTEVFIIPEVPRSSRPPVGRGRRWETVSASLPVDEGGELPWERPLPTGFAAAWHIVYLGVLPKQRITDIILERTGSEAERPEEPNLGEVCLAAVVLDGTGKPVDMSYMAASLVPGLARCIAGKGLDGLPLDMLKMQSEFDRKADSRDEPFSWPWIHAEIEHLFDLMEVRDEEMRIVVRSVHFRPDPKGRRIEDVQNDLLNSFFLNDLDRLLSLSKFGFEGVFARYLSDAEPVSRRDVLSSSEEGRSALDASLALRRMPRGRWPFRTGQHLLPAQLGAVNTILGSELSAVNGPPGTGKTRLLCEVVAHLVVERASRISRCRQPYEVFTAASGDFYPLREGLMRGTCMVATSSNNAAVENITRFLPSEEAVSRADFPEASYFPEVASAVSTACASPDSDDSGPRHAWGLLAAVLGSAWNCDQFARSFFWGCRDPEKDITLPGMKQVLDEHHDYEAHQKARGEWQKARTAFLETSRLLDQRLDFLENKAAGGAVSFPAPEAPSMLSQFLELMAQSKALQSTAREEDRAMQELASRLETLEEVVKQAQAEMAAQKKAQEARQETLRTPGRDFRDDADWQLKSVWNDEELSRLRSLLFLQALKLHEWTIKACPREFTANISVITRFLRGVPTEDADPEEIWNALFFMVPVVSSTLASFSRLFAGMGHASLDWVLLDEAGQASPQSAAGALWRARHAAVIGDPQQIEPVVPQPAALIDTLKERIKASDSKYRNVIFEKWSPLGQSAQTLADRGAELGTWMDSAGRRVWTGFPLRAHHRCAEPMFSIANRIAYDSQMVQARRAFPAVSSPLGRSRWLNVQGHTADTQLVQEELACLRRCMMAFQSDWPVIEGQDGPREASVFVISPFRKVAWHCRSLLRSMDIPEERVRCGTIHTFQGREADIVFLVLGSSPGQVGWGSRQWASRTPNILNVALTRAKSLIYVIGNWHDWRRHPFFDVLSEELPVESWDYPLSGNNRSENSSCLRLSGLFRPAGEAASPGSEA